LIDRPPATGNAPGSNVVLVMTASERTAGLVSDFLARMDASAPFGQRARAMLERRLKLYLWWKAKLAQREQAGRRAFAMPEKPKDFSRKAGDGVSDALRKKDEQNRERAASRRRTRGAAPVAGSSRQTPARETPAPRPAPGVEEIPGTGAMLDEAEDIAELCVPAPDPRTSAG
jgi:DNA excision repair protein ERCC-4